jgi:flagellar hook-associated protein 3 FlgL
MERIGVAEAKTGARLKPLDSQTNENESYLNAMKTTLSDIQDLDYAEAISRFEQQLLALQASQQTFVKIEGLSLFNYL